MPERKRKLKRKNSGKTTERQSAQSQDARTRTHVRTHARTRPIAYSTFSSRMIGTSCATHSHMEMVDGLSPVLAVVDDNPIPVIKLGLLRYLPCNGHQVSKKRLCACMRACVHACVRIGCVCARGCTGVRVCVCVRVTSALEHRSRSSSRSFTVYSSTIILESDPSANRQATQQCARLC